MRGICGTLSKAFLKSKKTAPTSHPLSKYCSQLSIVTKSAWTVDFPGWNPHCVFDSGEN